MLFFVEIFEFSLKFYILVFEGKFVDFAESVGFDFGLLEFLNQKFVVLLRNEVFFLALLRVLINFMI